MEQTANYWIDKRIGQYLIESLIKKGGMAYVYYAVDQALERPVALKILFSELTEDDSFVERFRREARSVAKLRHPNIVQIYTTGITPEGQNYIAMEYVSGGSLREQLQQLDSQGHVLQTEEAINITRQIAGALAVAHRAGIIHRDIKPSNILLRADGTPVLTDLGIAKIQSEATLTRVDEIIGTPYYMSPEQVASKPVDGRSDLYSLGMILYELLTGKRVFTGDTPWSILSKHITETPQPITELRPDISPFTANVVHTCLAKDPANRYQSADEMIAALDIALQSEQSGQPAPIGTPNYMAAAATAGVAAAATPTGSTRIATPAENETTEQKRPLWLIPLLLILLCLGGGIAAFFLTPLRGMVLGTATPDTTLVAAINTQDTASVSLETTDLPTDTPQSEETTIIEETTDTPEPTATDEPTDTPTDTPTATSEPTNTPRPTATDKPTNTPKPDNSPTPKSAANSSNPVGGSSSGGGLPMGFDQFGTWIRGDEANGSFTPSTTQAHSGGTSGKISYEFTSDDNDYVVFMQNNPIAGEPTALQIWVYGDGKGHYLNAWIQDREGQTWQVPFGKINHTGWKQLTGYIDSDQDWPWQHISGPKNEEIDYPISFRGFVFDDTNNAFNGSGTIYLDDLTTANIAYNGSASGSGSGDSNNNSNDNGTGSSANDDPPITNTGNIGRILYTSGNSVLTTDPSWSSPQELGTVASNTCSSPATTVTGDSYNLYFGQICNITGGIDTCRSPNGLHEVVVNGGVDGGTAVSVRPPGTEDYTFVYQGSLDNAEGIRWSPASESFLFVVDDTINRAFPNGNYNQIVSPAYSPIFSPDGSMILYLKPVGAGVKDVFVSNSDGSNARNVTNVSTIDKQCHAWRR